MFEESPIRSHTVAQPSKLTGRLPRQSSRARCCRPDHAAIRRRFRSATSSTGVQ